VRRTHIALLSMYKKWIRDRIRKPPNLPLPLSSGSGYACTGKILCVVCAGRSVSRSGWYKGQPYQIGGARIHTSERYENVLVRGDSVNQLLDACCRRPRCENLGGHRRIRSKDRSRELKTGRSLYPYPHTTLRVRVTSTIYKIKSVFIDAVCETYGDKHVYQIKWARIGTFIFGPPVNNSSIIDDI
jgi:hypothetical protein